MTNEQIIANVASTIYGEDEVNKMIENGEDIPLHTLKGWEELGNRKGIKYKIRKGEHGIECRLWKKKKKKADSEDDKKDCQESLIKSNRDFYMCKSFLFSGEQVEQIKE